MEDNIKKKEDYSLDDYNAKNVFKTLEEAQQYLRANFEKGIGCPCCGQFVKKYKRKLAATPSRMLIRLYELGGNWNHVKLIAKDISGTGTGDFSKLAYWKLIEEQPNDDSNKKNSGYWRITHEGRLFVENKITLASHVYVYNTKCLGFSDKHINIITSLGKKFNYAELMSNM